MSGAFSGFFSALMNTPLEYVKIQAQINEGRERARMTSIIKNSIKTNGPFALYRGFLPMNLREITAFSIYFSFYEMGKKTFIRGDEVGALMFVKQLLVGACSGISSWGFCYPFDLIKNII